MKTLAATATILLTLTTACTPGATAGPITPSLTPSPAATSVMASHSVEPTPALDKDQQAALKAVGGYYQVRERLMRDPSPNLYRIAEDLGRYAGADMVTANLKFFSGLKKRGEKYVGAGKMTWVRADEKATGAVLVHVCRDLRAMTLVDKKGQTTRALAPVLRTFTVRTVAEGVRVVAEKEGSGTCG